jgi:hypothetical protein
MPRAITAAATLLLATTLTACGTPADDQAGPPNEAVAVVGTSECVITDRTFNGDMITELFECTVEMSDPRVTGTETLTAVTQDGDKGGVWTVDDAVLTTGDGTWRGTGQGVVDYVGVLPTAQGMAPYNYGELHYRGEGRYEGLEFHYYLSASNSGGAYAGWIASTD